MSIEILPRYAMNRLVASGAGVADEEASRIGLLAAMFGNPLVGLLLAKSIADSEVENPDDSDVEAGIEGAKEAARQAKENAQKAREDAVRAQQAANLADRAAERAEYAVSQVEAKAASAGTAAAASTAASLPPKKGSTGQSAEGA